MSTHPPSTPIDAATVRAPGEPAPDLTDYRVVHRAMTIDLGRLARVAGELADHHDRRRMRLLRWYLRGVSAEIESHHHVEDDDVWPFLVALAGERAALVELTDEHERLDPLLHRAAELAARDRAVDELAAVLREIAELLDGHIEHEERDVFSMITDLVRVEDYRRLQERFRGNLTLGKLLFVVPWAVRHASPSERAAMIAEAPGPFRILLALVEPRFRRRERQLFGSAVEQ